MFGLANLFQFEPDDTKEPIISSEDVFYIEEPDEDFAVEDENWRMTLPTSSRTDVVKVACILSRALDLSALSEDGVLIAVEGGPRTGKCLVLDTILHDLSDARNCYKEPPDNKMYLERQPDEAMIDTVTGIDTLRGEFCNVSFRNFSKLREHYVLALNKPNAFNMVSYNYSRFSPKAMEHHSGLGLHIKVEQQSFDMWDAKWEIFAGAPQQTSAMRSAFYQLNMFAQRRQAKQLDIDTVSNSFMPEIQPVL